MYGQVIFLKLTIISLVFIFAIVFNAAGFDGNISAASAVVMEQSTGKVIYSKNQNSDVLIEIAFENGKLRLEGEKLYDITADGLNEICNKSESIYHGESYWGTGHSVLINDFYDCLKTGRKFEIDSFEGGHAAKIVAASYLSSKENQSIEITF